MFLQYDLGPYMEDDALNQPLGEPNEDFDLPLGDDEDASEEGLKGGVAEREDDWFVDDDSAMDGDYDEEEMSTELPDLLTPDDER